MFPGIVVALAVYYITYFQNTDTVANKIFMAAENEPNCLCLGPDLDVIEADSTTKERAQLAEQECLCNGQ